MSSGDFGAELQRSVKEHLDAIQAELNEAKERIAESVAGKAPPPAPEPPAFEPDASEGSGRRYNVSFEDAPGDERDPGSEADARES
ncbi:MAG: hypothetical protein ABI282_09510 [Candidatus Baltobacteraceae bacterium]